MNDTALERIPMLDRPPEPPVGQGSVLDLSVLDLTWRATQALSVQMTRHPYRSLLVAAGIGYVIGGGLFTRLTMRVIRMGARLGTLPQL
jgi:hypothetical protein